MARYSKRHLQANDSCLASCQQLHRLLSRQLPDVETKVITNEVPSFCFRGPHLEYSWVSNVRKELSGDLTTGREG
ncbi:unnamed protein product [Larinioides sclopetarius]|uniref:Uncharacterized protein n=1 Tax=Larinioides sclopetarius TaxID=280406 RepID=A0AAV1Z661_9ARAC